MGPVVLAANDYNMSDRGIHSFRQLKNKNLSIISDFIVKDTQFLHWVVVVWIHKRSFCEIRLLSNYITCKY